MGARHTKAESALVRSALSGLKSFRELEQRIESLATSNERGDVFEVFAEAYLAAVRKHDFRSVYPQDSAPAKKLRYVGLTRKDLGADGVAESILGGWCAYQVKFRSGRQGLNWEEMATFFGQADSSRLKHRFLLTNVDVLPSKALELRERFTAIRGSDFEKLDQNDFRIIEDYLTGSSSQLRNSEDFKRHEHQDEALRSIQTRLATASRACVFMACGSGKTLVALWAAEQSAARKVLVLVPSLALMKQVLGEWMKHTAWKSMAYLSVCSDSSVDTGLDEIRINPIECDFPVGTDASQVRRFLRTPFNGVKLVFTTYQSAQVVADGMRAEDVFDLAIFDEAHKTAGREGRRNTFALADRNIRIKKRLFFTATPRHFNPFNKDADGVMAKAYSMDDPFVYGETAYKLTFRDAVNAKIIVPYKVIVSVITSDQVTKEALGRGAVLIDGEDIRARQVASQLALKEAINKFSARHVFTFHHRVNAAKSFVATGPEGIARHLSGFATAYVDGSMSAAVRDGIVREFREAAVAILANARCLTEGVNVPGVDMVAFISPRRSRIDIVQAAGRAMRRAGDRKKVGYILLPLYVETAHGESIEEALVSSRCEELWEVLQALAEQDEMLADVIREGRRRKGIFGHSDANFGDFIEVIGEDINLERLRQAISVEAIARLGTNWDEMFGALVAYKSEFGDCYVPADFDRNRSLGIWAGTQRALYGRKKLDPGRVRLLEELGFDWDPHATQWSEMYQALSKYREAHGNCNVPQKYPANQQLAMWVGVQRLKYKKGGMPPERLRNLESIGFIWDPLEAIWDERFQELNAFKSIHGHSNVSSKFYLQPELGSWVTRQRVLYKNKSLRSDKILRLQSIGFQWTPYQDRWREMYSALLEFKEKNGHCNVPRTYKIKKGLSVWVTKQRVSYFNKSLRKDQCDQLESIGIDWDPVETRWKQQYQELKRFHEVHQHCSVPDAVSTHRALSIWVKRQRFLEKRGKLPGEKVRLLNALGYEWDPGGVRWDQMFLELKRFKAQNGHCNPTANKAGNQELVNWVIIQRVFRNKGKLAEDRIGKLDRLGFCWDMLTAKWEGMFSGLLAFRNRFGHCNVPDKFADNPSLGSWATTQRMIWKKGKLSPERIARLEKIGFVRDPRTAYWEQMVAEMRKFKKANGHCKVPRLYEKNLSLGYWAQNHRSAYMKGALEQSKIDQMRALGMID